MSARLLSATCVLLAGGALAADADVVRSTPASRAGDVSVTSHGVTRHLPRDRNRTLPVDSGGRVTIAATPGDAVRLVLNGRRVRVSSTGRGRFATSLPESRRLPARARIEVDGSAYGVRLRQHRHRPIHTFPYRRYIIDWGYAPRSLAEMVRRTKHAVFAQVTSVRQGPPENLDEPGHEIEGVPSQRIRFRTEQRWFGHVGSRFRLYKTGTQHGWGEGDPPYVRGERYLVFLGTRRDDGSFLPTAIHGRLRLDTGLLRPFIGGPVARRLAWLTVDEARVAVVAIRQRQTALRKPQPR